MAEGLQRDIFNQCALRRLDPNLREVVGFSAFVAIYKFSPSDNQWKKTDVEGTLFVCARSGEPSHNILVLNRLNPINFIEPICGELILQRREPFLFYVTPKCSLYGIWFYDRGDCLRVSYLIEGIKRQLVTAPVADDEWSDIATFKSLMGMSDPPSNSGRMASRGKKSASSDGKTSSQAKKLEKGKSRIAAQLNQLGGGNCGSSARGKKPGDEEGAMAVGGAAEGIIRGDEDQTPKSVVDFFARAGNAPINTQVGLVPAMPEMYGDDSDGASVNPIVHQIVTDPYHSLEHVEKQQIMATSQQPTAGSSEQPKAGRSQQPKAGSSQKPKTARSQKSKAANTQKSKAPSTQRAKEDGTQKSKEGEGKSSKPDAPSTLVEFLNRLKISRSANPGPEGRIEEIPDLLSMIPEPPIPNITSMPRPFQPIPFLPGHIGPIETFHFMPGPVDGFGFMSGSSRPLSSFPKPDLDFLHAFPPDPSVLMPEHPPPLPPMPERPAPLPPTPEPPARLLPTPEPPARLSQTPEPPLLLSQTPEPLLLLSQTPEPAPLPPTPEPAAPLSPTPEPPVPLSSILKQTRRSMPPKPTLPKPLSLLPKPPEPSLSSMPPPMFASKNSKIDASYNDHKSQAAAAAAAGNNAGGGGGGIGNINFNDSDGEGVNAAAAADPLLHVEGHDFSVETLTRDQLLRAIHYLLQNDPSFINKIHEAYLKSLTDKYP